MGSSFAPCVDIGRTYDDPVRSRTYGGAAAAGCSNSGDHLGQCCADAANRLLAIGIPSSRPQARMGGAERERLGNEMHAQFAEHDLQRELGFHAAEQAG